MEKQSWKILMLSFGSLNKTMFLLVAYHSKSIEYGYSLKGAHIHLTLVYPSKIWFLLLLNIYPDAVNLLRIYIVSLFQKMTITNLCFLLAWLLKIVIELSFFDISLTARYYFYASLSQKRSIRDDINLNFIRVLEPSASQTSSCKAPVRPIPKSDGMKNT